MTSEAEPTQEQLPDTDEEEEVGYEAPAKKSVVEILEQDKDDESLVKYKKSLLGTDVVPDIDTSVPNVQVTRMSLVCDEAPAPLVIDLTGDLKELKNTPLVVKEGVDYRVKFNFKVNREIVSGLKYVQNSKKKGLNVTVDKMQHMIGSFGPRPAEYEFLTTVEQSPCGVIARGTYVIKSKFTDDDKHDHLSWEWYLTIKKNWQE